MPYDNLKELPDSVRDNLPEHAQEIYKEAYNSAWDQYKDPEDRRGDASREETAHRVMHPPQCQHGADALHGAHLGLRVVGSDARSVVGFAVHPGSAFRSGASR